MIKETNIDAIKHALIKVGLVWVWEDSHQSREQAEYWAKYNKKYWNEVKIIKGGDKTSEEFPYAVWLRGRKKDEPK